MPMPRRSDARRNRAAIIRAAAEVVGRGRPLPSAREIARLTGLGLATVYRHFPDRRGLLLAITEEHMAVLRRAAGRSDPPELADLLGAVMAYQARMRGVADELRRCPAADQHHHVRMLLDTLREPFARSHAAGHLNANVVLDDIPVVLAMFQTAVDHLQDPRALQRVVMVLLGGLFHTVPPEPPRLVPMA
ncbi:TetR/AcrR family transcriptional regulator [Actinokineospora sp. 24-640]